MARSRSLRCVALLALFCGTAIGTHASWAQEAADPSGIPSDVSASDGGTGDEALPPPPPPIFSSAGDEQAPRRPKLKALDPYAPIGIKAGAFTLFPSFEIGVEDHSNIRLAPSAPQKDMGLRLKPSLGFASDWSRHSLTGNVSAQWLRYGDDDNLSTFTGAANVDLKIDVRHDIGAEFKADTAITETGLGTSSLPSAAISARTDQSSHFSAGLANGRGGVVITSTIALARNTYGDVALSGGGTENNSDLNYYEPSLSLRGSLGGRGSRLMPYAEITYAPRTHDQALDRNGIARNSQGGALSLGVKLDDGPIWTGEMAVTGQYRNYADPSLGSIFGVGLNGTLAWSPTPLDKAILTASLSQAETSNVALAATNTWAFGLDISHSVFDNFQLLAGTSLSLADNGSGIEKTATIDGGFEYAFNPDLASKFTLQQAWHVDGPGTVGYSDQSLIASIILRR